ncbi:hypothetical protein AB4423_07015 [Vibrio chagasii]|uniref:hypothetical protein n=1 Tax=Vibrio chagasii TaxID=170679 RepID=UPI0035540BEF
MKLVKMNVFELLKGASELKVLRCSNLVFVIFTLTFSNLVFSEEVADIQPSINQTTVYAGPITEVTLPDIKLKLDIDKIQSGSGGVSGSDILAGLALLVAFGTFGFQIYQHSQQKRVSIRESFWMREILIPRFLDRFLNFTNEAIECYQSAESLGDFYQSYALFELNFLKDASAILNAGYTGLGDDVYGLLESFDDDIQEVENVGQFSMLLNDLSLQVIKSIKSAQEKIA